MNATAVLNRSVCQIISSFDMTENVSVDRTITEETRSSRVVTAGQTNIPTPVVIQGNTI